MSEQLPIDYYLNKINERIVVKFRHELFKKIQMRVIKNLQKHSAGVLPEGILRNMWDEICVITQEDDDEFYYACIDTIDSEIELIFENMDIPEWQLCAMWLDTPKGFEWVLDDKDKNPEEIALTYNMNDIKKHIRDQYILDAAMDWSNGRIERFQQLSYMDY